MKRFPDYGVDAPYVIKNLIVGSIFLSVFYITCFYLLSIYFPNHWLLVVTSFAAIATPTYMLGTAALMFWSSKVGKLWQADKLLNQISWHGNEQVLDIGCGRGLLLIKAAKKLTTGGTVTGIDIWSQTDLSNNNAQATMRNAQIEGVADKVQVLDADARELPFADASFDVIVSSLVIHNLAQEYNRKKILDEMIRVVKPAGYLLIQDIFYTKEYATYLKTKNLSVIRLSNLQWFIFPPVRMIIVQNKQ